MDALLLVLFVVLFIVVCWLFSVLAMDAFYTLVDEYRNKHGIEDALRVFYKYKH